MTTQTTESSAFLNTEPEEGFEAYRSFSKLAVISFFFGMIGLLSYLFGVFLAFLAPNTLIDTLQSSPGIGLLLSVSLAVHGLLMVLAGLVARTVFNNAKALHSLSMGDPARAHRKTAT